LSLLGFFFYFPYFDINQGSRLASPLVPKNNERIRK
jgi:hypothetical protein